MGRRVRALDISVFILILSACLSGLSAVFGYGTAPVKTPVTLQDIAAMSPENQTVEGWSVYPVTGLFRWANLLLKIMIGCATLGNTIDNLIYAAVGARLPSEFVAGLDAISIIAIAIAVFQLLFGRIVKFMQ